MSLQERLRQRRAAAAAAQQQNTAPPGPATSIPVARPAPPATPSANTQQAPNPVSGPPPQGNPAPPRGVGSRFYQLPGNVDDLREDPVGSAGWSNTIHTVIEGLVKNGGPKSHFFNEATRKFTHAEQMAVKWRAYPKNQEDTDDMWQTADIRKNQDEYCEWEVEKGADGELLSATFTTEVPEYWGYLSTVGRKGDRLIKLYEELNPDADIKYEDLFDKNGQYKPMNRWNYPALNNPEQPATTGCIAHMIVQNNTLPEAASLVADSSALFDDGKGGYLKDGVAILAKMVVSDRSKGRNSDPLIAAQFSAYAQRGKRIALANPVGLYIHSVESDKFRVAGTGEPLNWSQVWTIERGTDRAVRAKFKVPRRLVGRIRVNGRKLEYGSQIAQHLWVAVHAVVTDALRPQVTTLQPVYTFIEGRHIKPVKLADDIVSDELQSEPFGDYLATTEFKDRAITLDKLLSTFDPHTWVSYAADEGIGVTFNTPRDKVRVRLVILHTPCYPAPPRDRHASKMADITRFKQRAFKVPTLAVVAVPPSDDPNNYNSSKSILQIASFNPDVGWFNFYDRERGTGGSGRWLYFGNSKDAFTPDTQGLGPFCGHANGGLVMKEPEEPWLHWHSSMTELELPTNHPMHNDPLYRHQDSGTWYFDGAEELADMINTANDAWFNKRHFLDFGDGYNPNQTALRVHQWIAHICMTTTITICSSRTRENRSFRVPSGFFFNARAFNSIADGFKKLEEKIKPIPWNHYQEANQVLRLQTVEKFAEKPADKDVVAADTEGQAFWKVVGPAAEDVAGIERILSSGLLPKNVVLALLLVDFWNPVFSHRRAQLMRYIPSTATLQDPASKDDKYGLGSDLVEVVTNAIPNLDLDPKTSPEAEFLDLVKNPNLLQVAKARIQAYVDKINAELAKPSGVLNFMRIAETKRRLFRPPPRYQKPLHPLAEFDMSLPYASRMQEKETYYMKEDATAEAIPPPSKIWHPRNTQAHFSSAGCPFSSSF